MRIIGYIPHPTLKITIFHYENRFSLKFENASYEQTYKIRPVEGLNNEEDIRNMVSSEFLDKIEARFISMHAQMSAVYQDLITKDSDEFDSII
jgi:hypothetical protein